MAQPGGLEGRADRDVGRDDVRRRLQRRSRLGRLRRRRSRCHGVGHLVRQQMVTDNFNYFLKAAL